MAEQRTNGLGQTVEFNEKSGRWEPVKTQTNHVESTDTPEETSAPVPTDQETVVEEGDAPQRRAWRDED